MTLPKPVIWKADSEKMLDAIQWACKKVHYSIDRPGMNTRSLSEKLDDKIMGDLATIAMLEYLYQLNVEAVAYDYIRTDDFQLPDPGWDIAIGKGAEEWARNTANPRTPTGLRTASVRSSRLPRTDSLDKAISIRDFKIFAPLNRRIEDCIKTDIEAQVYYDYQSTQLAGRTITQDHIAACIGDHAKGEEIATRLDIEGRFGACYLTAWNYRDEIVRYSHTLKEPTWSSFGKRMWIAPLRYGKNMNELLELR